GGHRTEAGPGSGLRAPRAPGAPANPRRRRAPRRTGRKRRSRGGPNPHAARSPDRTRPGRASGSLRRDARGAASGTPSGRVAAWGPSGGEQFGDGAGQDAGLSLGHLPAQRGDAVLGAPLLAAAAVPGDLDQAPLEHAVEHAVQVARPDADPALGADRDVLDDPISVERTVAQHG